MTARLPAGYQWARFGASVRPVARVAGDTGGATSPAQRVTSMGLSPSSTGPSSGLPDLALSPTAGRAPTGVRAARVRYRRALMLMVMTLVVPGSAQLAAGNRRVGRIATRIWAALLLASFVGLVMAALHHQYAFWFVTDTTALG